MYVKYFIGYQSTLCRYSFSASAFACACLQQHNERERSCALQLNSLSVENISIMHAALIPGMRVKYSEIAALAAAYSGIVFSGVTVEVS